MKKLALAFAFVFGIILMPIGSLAFIIGAFGDAPAYMAFGLIAMTAGTYSVLRSIQ